MIEAIVASPPERDDLVIQLFASGRGQWGEVYRHEDSFWIELYSQPDGQPWQFPLEEVISVLSLSLRELQARSGSRDK
jgi:hypothetical protein